jgi:hypothetical protein
VGGGGGGGGGVLRGEYQLAKLKLRYELVKFAMKKSHLCFLTKL